jgi:hypothetical protein
VIVDKGVQDAVMTAATQLLAAAHDIYGQLTAFQLSLLASVSLTLFVELLILDVQALHGSTQQQHV